MFINFWVVSHIFDASLSLIGKPNFLNSSDMVSGLVVPPEIASRNF